VAPLWKIHLKPPSIEPSFDLQISVCAYDFTPTIGYVSGKRQNRQCGYRAENQPESQYTRENIAGLVDILSEQFTLRAVSYSPAEECINNCIDNRAECLSDK
jgi:hypothetical protein